MLSRAFVVHTVKGCDSCYESGLGTHEYGFCRDVVPGMMTDWWRRYEKKMQKGRFRVLMKDVADAAGVSYSQLNRWVNGVGEPSISQAVGMVVLVGTSLNEIFIPNVRAKNVARARIQEQRQKRLSARKRR